MTSLQKRPWIVIVGGFLGSGKTSLILKAAQVLEQRELRCAVILNDQGNKLVDTQLAQTAGMIAREVTGGCFCCRFSGLMELVDELRSRSLDVIFAEPVGSCTDISATVLGPLREQFDSYRIAPFTVLADPDRTASLLSDDADSDMAFLFRNQLKEADLVCMSKADLYPDLAGIPGIAARCVSAKSGEGVAEWLDEVLFGSLEAGHTTLEIDYARYARAEAALAWLNLSLTFEPDQYASPALVVGPFLDRMDAALTAAGIAIVHLKIFDRSPAGWLKAAACANGEEPHVEGNLDASPTGRHELLVNLRAVADAGRVRAVVEEQVRQLPGAVLNARLDCFSPSPPRPERRVPKKNA